MLGSCPTQLNYSTIKKEILSIVLCISKWFTKSKVLIKIDCKSAKRVLEKDVQNIASKQIFARWQAILSVFYFDIEFIEGTQNSIPDFLTHEFLQNPTQNVREKASTVATIHWTSHDPYKRSISLSNGSFATKLAFSSKGPKKIH